MAESGMVGTGTQSAHTHASCSQQLELVSLLLLLLLQVHTNPFQLVGFDKKLLEPGSRPFTSNFFKVCML
jgi:hypothetical protein